MSNPFKCCKNIFQNQQLIMNKSQWQILIRQPEGNKEKYNLTRHCIYMFIVEQV